MLRAAVDMPFAGREIYKLDRYRTVYVVNPPSAANDPKRAISSWHPARYATGSPEARGILLQRSTIGGWILALLLLGGCQEPAGSGTSPAVPAAPGDYPDLASVPPRPQLSYTIEQRREIADQLVADRENARHREAELAYATGRSDTPPPPPPAAAPPAPEAPQPAPAAPAAAAPVEPAGDAAIARAYVDENLNASNTNRRLHRFMRRLERKAPDPYGPASIAEAVGLAGSAEPAAGEAAPPAEAPPAAPPATSGGAEAQPGALQRFGSYLGGILGVEGDTKEPAAAPQPAAAPAPDASASMADAVPAMGAVVARVPFADRSTSLAPGAQEQLARAVELARAAKARLKIVAPAGPQALGIDRGRQVAVGLMQAGASASQLDLGTGGTGDEVVVYLAPSQRI
jgi:hypothetical protein